MKHLSHLTNRELQVLTLLAKGTPPNVVCARLNITTSNYYVVCAKLRKKTGIKNIRDASECYKVYSNRGVKALSGHPKLQQPTPQQIQVMTMRAVNGMSYAGISRTLNIGQQTAMNIFAQGCKRAGITGPASERIGAIRAYLQSRNSTPVPHDDFL
jgi:DNA-binding CsgD family transcriptional regulator